MDSIEMHYPWWCIVSRIFIYDVRANPSTIQPLSSFYRINVLYKFNKY